MGLPTRAPLLLLVLAAVSAVAYGAGKPHTVFVGSGKMVPYSAEGDPAGAQSGESQLRVRPLIVDGKLKEWTTGQWHDITDRSFVIRRALRLNDELPGDKSEHWVWQRGPWLLVDRTKGTITALRLPDYEPTVSDVIWFRDNAAYCGLTVSGKQLYAVVAQVAAHRPLLARKLAPWTPGESASPACAPAVWQRDPLGVTFQLTGAAPIRFNLVGDSAVLIEDGNGNDDDNSSDK